MSSPYWVLFLFLIGLVLETSVKITNETIVAGKYVIPEIVGIQKDISRFQIDQVRRTYGFTGKMLPAEIYKN